MLSAAGRIQMRGLCVQMPRSHPLGHRSPRLPFLLFLICLLRLSLDACSPLFVPSFSVTNSETFLATRDFRWLRMTYFPIIFLHGTRVNAIPRIRALISRRWQRSSRGFQNCASDEPHELWKLDYLCHWIFFDPSEPQLFEWKIGCKCDHQEVWMLTGLLWHLLSLAVASTTKWANQPTTAVDLVKVLTVEIVETAVIPHREAKIMGGSPQKRTRWFLHGW